MSKTENHVEGKQFKKEAALFFETLKAKYKPVEKRPIYPPIYYRLKRWLSRFE